MSNNNRAISASLAIFLCLVLAGPLAAAGQFSLDVNSTIIVPVEQGSDALVYQPEEPLDLSVGDYVYQVKVVQTLPADKDTNVLIKDPILVLLDQPVKIIAPEKIQVLKMPGGTSVDSSQLEVQRRTVIMTVPLTYGTDYQVVFGERALESTVTADVYNAAFDWTFSTEKDPGSDDNGGDDSSGGDSGDEGGT